MAKIKLLFNETQFFVCNLSHRELKQFKISVCNFYPAFCELPISTISTVESTYDREYTNTTFCMEMSAWLGVEMSVDGNSLNSPWATNSPYWNFLFVLVTEISRKFRFVNKTQKILYFHIEFYKTEHNLKITFYYKISGSLYMNASCSKRANLTTNVKLQAPHCDCCFQTILFCASRICLQQWYGIRDCW